MLKKITTWHDKFKVINKLFYIRENFCQIQTLQIPFIKRKKKKIKRKFTWMNKVKIVCRNCYLQDNDYFSFLGELFCLFVNLISSWYGLENKKPFGVKSSNSNNIFYSVEYINIFTHLLFHQEIPCFIVFQAFYLKP